MLNIVIKFLENFLRFLKNRQKESIKIRKAKLANSDSTKFSYVSKTSMVITMLIWGIIAFFITVSSIEIFDDNQLLAWSLSVIVNWFLLYTLVRNLNWKYLFLVHLPLYIWLFSFIVIFDRYFPSEFWLYNTILNILLLIFPIIYILQYYFKFLNRKCIDKFKNIFYLYNWGFFFVITLNVLLISIWFNIEFIQPWSEMIIEVLGNNYINGFLEGILYLIFVFIVLLYWVYTLHVYYDNLWAKRVNLHKAIWVFLVIYCLWFTSAIVDEFYDYQIQRANEIVKKQWNNYESYRDARVLFLDRAFLNRIEQWRWINESLFNKIYDSTVVWYYWERISKYMNDRSSFATNSSKIWDSADVVLKLAEIENKVFKTEWYYKTSLLETTYKFHFTNETNISQEVILNFETPSKTSVISSLRLWMDLELIWQISSRWAARKVYEDSLRRNTDPALIEKVWLNTYSLKVFPIPSKTWKTWWRQLVEVKILTPISEEEFIYSPKFSVINLKFDDSSRLQSKVYNAWELIKEDVIKSDDIEDYISMDHTIKSDDLNLELKNWFENICLSDFVQDELDRNNVVLPEEKNIWKKIKVFFDNSYSVKRNDASDLYENIYNEIKNHNGKLNDVDLYSYNFEVVKLTWVGDINYWGYSDIDRAIDYIVNNNIKNEKIIFITDDDSFNFNTEEKPSRNLEELISNNIFVIKIWNNPKTYKSDFNTILSATNWNIYEVDSKESVDSVVNKILDNKNNIISFERCEITVETIDYNVEKIEWINEIEELFFTGTGAEVKYPENNAIIKEILIDENIQKIQAWIVSNLLLWNIKNKNDWTKIANMQNRLAEEYNIVNQFNSLIAIETKQQQIDLDKYNKKENKYDTEYESNWINTKSIWSRIMRETNNILMDDIWYCNSWECWLIEWIDSISFNRWASVNSDLKSGNINLKGSSSYDSVGFDMSFSGRTEISFIWVIIMIIYLLEYIGFINFIIKYKKEKKD